MGIEELNEVQVAQKRGLNGAETMAFVRSELATALETFAPLQEEPLASTTAPLQDLGTYPLHAIVDMFTFDITTHLRYDIVKPRGPIEVNLRPLDERQLGPAVSWLLAGIPRMQRKLPRDFAGPLSLDLTGPAGTRVTIRSDGAAITVTPGAESASEPRAIITSSTDDFLAWSTTRLPWQQLVSVEGDRDEAPASSTPSTWSRGERRRILSDAARGAVVTGAITAKGGKARFATCRCRRS